MTGVVVHSALEGKIPDRMSSLVCISLDPGMRELVVDVLRLAFRRLASVVM